MRTISRFALVTAAALTLASTLSAAQNSATTTASAKANIISPITLVKVVGADLNFGDVVPGAVAGTVTVDPASARTSGGGVSLGNGAAVSAAAFTVGGAGSATYSITLPGSAVTITSGANNMTVTGFTSSPSLTGTLSAGGTQTLSVGGTLNVGINQAVGAYTGTFSVTVAYN
jgi:hypothetical protein